MPFSPSSESAFKEERYLYEFVTSEDVGKAKVEVIKKKGIELVKEVKFEKISEGKCV